MSDADVFGGAPQAAAAPAPQAGGLMSDDDVFGSTKPEQHAVQQPATRSWASVPVDAVKNLPSSIGNQIGNVWQAVRHPVDTAKAIGNTAVGAAQDLDDAIGLNGRPAPKTAQQKQFDNVKDFYASRYGSAEGFKKALATDPGGVMADAATVFIGGESALAKLPGLAGKTGELAGTIGRNINPLNAPINAANAAIKGVNKGVNAVRNATAPVSPEAQAAAYVAQRTPPATLDAFAQATQGKPAMAAEATRQGITGMRALGLREGQTGDTLGAMLAERAEGAPGRVMNDFQQATGISPHAALGDIDQVVKDGREAAKPLYDKAFDNGGTGAFIAPLEKRFDLTTGQVAQARHDLTLATAKLSAAGDNAPATLFRQQEAAQKAYDAALSTKNATNTRLQTAYEDEENGVRGGVWSPRIQQFLDDPIMKAGLARGLEVQRLEALGKGEPFNPRDYAITGTSPDGSPIIGGVPNMRLLDAGKRGLDEIIGDYVDKTTGKLQVNERVKALLGVKSAYLQELDGLNPDYAAARGASSDYLSARGAFDKTAKLFSNPNTTAKMFDDHIGSLEGTDLDAGKGGAANWLFNQAQQGRLSPKKLGTPLMKQKITTLVGDQDKADAFIGHLKTEADLAKSGARMAPGVNSTTYETGEAASDQDHAGAVMDAAHAVKNLVTGHPIKAMQKAGSSLDKSKAFARTPGMPVPVRDEAGRIWRMPPAEAAEFLRIAPPVPPPPPLRGMIPQSGRLGALGAAQLGQLTDQQPYRRGGFV